MRSARRHGSTRGRGTRRAPVRRNRPPRRPPERRHALAPRRDPSPGSPAPSPASAPAPVGGRPAGRGADPSAPPPGAAVGVAGDVGGDGPALTAAQAAAIGHTVGHTAEVIPEGALIIEGEGRGHTLMTAIPVGAGVRAGDEGADEVTATGAQTGAPGRTAPLVAVFPGVTVAAVGPVELQPAERERDQHSLDTELVLYRPPQIR